MCIVCLCRKKKKGRSSPSPADPPQPLLLVITAWNTRWTVPAVADNNRASEGLPRRYIGKHYNITIYITRNTLINT